MDSFDFLFDQEFVLLDRKIQLVAESKLYCSSLEATVQGLQAERVLS